VFTIFSTIPIQVTYKNDVSTGRKVFGFVYFVVLCCAVKCESVLCVATLCCVAVLIGFLGVCLKREEELSSLRAKLLDP
jgi:hypothetical protein